MCGDGANDCGVSAGHLQVPPFLWVKTIWNITDCSFLLAESCRVLSLPPALVLSSVSGFEASAQRDLPVRAGGLRGVTLHLHYAEHLLCPHAHQVARQSNQSQGGRTPFYDVGVTDGALVRDPTPPAASGPLYPSLGTF